MSEFHDPELRNELARLSGPYPDDNAAFVAWQRRVGQVRRRRAVAWTTGAALSLIVATVAVAAVQRPDRHTVVPGKSAETSADVTFAIASTEAHDTTSTAPTTTASISTVAETLAPETTTTVVETAVPVTPAVEPEDTSSNGSSGGSSGTSKGHGTTPPTSPPDTEQSLTQTFSSVGGSISVRQNNDRLTVVAKNAAPGFEVTERNRSGRKVEVTFESDDHRSTITVRLDDGVMKPDVEENDDDYGNRGHDRPGPDDTAPDTTSGDDHGDGSGSGSGHGPGYDGGGSGDG